MKKYFVIQFIALISLLFSQVMAQGSSQDNFGLETTIDANTSRRYAYSARGGYIEENPVTIALRVDSDGGVDLIDVNWVQFSKTYHFEDYEGVEVKLAGVGARYEQIHEALGYEYSINYAHFTIQKSYMLDDGVTLILSGVGKLNSSSSIKKFNRHNSFKDEAESIEGFSFKDSYSTLYSNTDLSLDLEASAEIHFNIGEGSYRGYAHYKRMDNRDFTSSNDVLNYTLARQEAVVGLEYRPSVTSNHRFGFQVKKTVIDDSLNSFKFHLEESTFMLTYKYRFNIERLFGFKDREVEKSDWESMVKDYAKQELELPKFE